MHSCNISRRRLAAEPEGDSGLSAVRGWRSYQSLACSWWWQCFPCPFHLPTYCHPPWRGWGGGRRGRLLAGRERAREGDPYPTNVSWLKKTYVLSIIIPGLISWYYPFNVEYTQSFQSFSSVIQLRCKQLKKIKMYWSFLCMHLNALWGQICVG